MDYVRNKELKFGNDARKAMRNGIDVLADAVGSTLGPNGNLVVIGKYSNGKPHVTKDGVTVAKNISFKDEYMDAGAQLVKEAALKQLVVGDGTTTTTVLAQQLIHEIDIQLSNGKSPNEIKNKLDEDLVNTINYINENSVKIESNNDLRKVATISANNDAEIGELIADTFEVISRDGVITVDESSNIETTVETISGMQFDNGYVSPYFCTDNVKNTCTLDKPYIFITDQKIRSILEIKNVIEAAYKEGNPILFIAEEFDSEVINTLAVNMMNGLRICCVKSPSFGDYRVPILEDLGILTDGSIATYGNTLEPKDVTVDMLGRADKVVVTSTSTTIIGGYGSLENIDKRIASIKVKLKEAEEDPQHSDFIVNYYKGRIARLAGGVAVIHVGGTTELERGERKDRIDDAVAAVSAALEEGIVSGGGTIYLKASQKINNDSPMYNALLSITKKLYSEKQALKLSNCYTKDIKSLCGINAKTGEWVDNMIDSGIVDPTKTVKMALMNAVSVAELYLKTNCIIVPEQIPII